MIVTSFGQKGFHKYGRKFIESFIENWQKDEQLVVWFEKSLPKDHPKHKNVKYHNLFNEDEFKDFLDLLLQSDPLYQGLMLAQDGKSQAYNYRYDACKFFRKVYAIMKTALTLNEHDRYLTWLDADVVIEKPVPENLISGMFDEEDLYCVHLYRDWCYSETGFIAFDTEHEINEPFMRLMWATYANGGFKYLGEFHDCYVFDLIRCLTGVKSKSITTNEGDRYLFDSSILGQYMVHNKGPERKGEAA